MQVQGISGDPQPLGINEIPNPMKRKLNCQHGILSYRAAGATGAI